MNTLNNFDTLENLIHKDNIRIQAIDVHMDMLLVILNTGMVIKEQLSKYPTLMKASEQQLKDYELIGNGTGIHWPMLDEDISLKGLLRDTIRNQVINKVA